MVTFTLSPDQTRAAFGAATAALNFEESRHFPLGVAIVRHHFDSGTSEVVVDALRSFQNADGGFGRGLEVDIASPASNPFAARLAMAVLLGLREVPKTGMVSNLGTWLNSTQEPDGDWHFSQEVRSDSLAPWFGEWAFPSLNPACCVSGLANALGLLGETTLSRTAQLFQKKASIEEARTGNFYTLLPYVEYSSSIDFPHRDQYLDAIAENIRNATYDDAGHFFDHALGAGPDLVKRIEPALLSTYADRLIEEQSDDGGWPNPYSDAWRPFASAAAIMTLAKLRDGV